MLKPLMEKYDSFIITEKTSYESKTTVKSHYMLQVNRREALFIPKMCVNFLKAAKIMAVEKPDVVITTGVLAMIPISILAKMCGKKLIYIESFAKVTSATLTGKLLYKYADKFYVQWEQMLKIY